LVAEEEPRFFSQHPWSGSIGAGVQSLALLKTEEKASDGLDP